MNFLLCDGSVRMVTDEISPNLFADLTTIDGGEIASLPTGE